LIKHAIDIGWMKGDPMVGLNRPIIKTEAGIGFTVAGFSDWFRDHGCGPTARLQTAPAAEGTEKAAGQCPAASMV